MQILVSFGYVIHTIADKNTYLFAQVLFLSVFIGGMTPSYLISKIR